jgi:Zn-dependent protease with chaperone function/type II secretory pathway pseudopilin PulG
MLQGGYVKEFIYPRDKSLTAVTMVLGIVMWLAGIYLLVRYGGAKSLGALVTFLLIAAFLTFLAYLFARSAVIAHIRGHGVEVTEAQLPGLHRQFVECCEKLALAPRPQIFILNGNGVLNAFATWFLGRKYVVLLSSVVDAMEANPSGVRFYIGHELAHVIRHDNPLQHLLRWPAQWLPILGAAFSRARESTCDQHGMACSASREDAARSLVALAAGAKQWKVVSLEALATQVAAGSGFWMSFHELTASYPWTAKRVERVRLAQPALPRRNPFAYLLAAFVPYAGRLGAGLGVLLYVYFIGIIAAIAIPAYQDYVVRQTLTQAIVASQHAREALAASYLQSRKIPESLSSIGVDEAIPNGTMHVGPEMVLTVVAAKGSLLFTPQKDPSGQIIWRCSPGSQFRPAQLPPSCR